MAASFSIFFSLSEHRFGQTLEHCGANQQRQYEFDDVDEEENADIRDDDVTKGNGCAHVEIEYEIHIGDAQHIHRGDGDKPVNADFDVIGGLFCVFQHELAYQQADEKCAYCKARNVAKRGLKHIRKAAAV